MTCDYYTPIRDFKQSFFVKFHKRNSKRMKITKNIPINPEKIKYGKIIGKKVEILTKGDDMSKMNRYKKVLRKTSDEE